MYCFVVVVVVYYIVFYVVVFVVVVVLVLLLLLLTLKPSLVFPHKMSRLSGAWKEIAGNSAFSTELTKNKKSQRLPHVAFTGLACDS